ncbi:hypothetical protein I6F18_29915 [Bradyrhizobium sp. NBAIM32]|jgi:hypothetical protein|uniref:hypothetical protein n=1 Tax=Bradyrhizobium sp. NBAIM32 TaxID=2793809 RepID=UPI001CD37A2D|nr:hypothetical protein [Bradyrhizobium sp. NBAIM32]MCA1544161.1 hypothetical protein [Bradyrhizobium sp. NBAIM32]
MNDPLLDRAQLAIEESKALQRQRRALEAEQLHNREALRSAVLESAIGRTEIKAYRDNRE